MAKREPGATLPVVTVRGTHADLGRAMGKARSAEITAAVGATLAALHEQGTSDADLHEQVAPYLEAARRTYPELVVELEAMADSAGVPFEALFRLNSYESRPPGTPFVALPPASPIPAKDPPVLPEANDPAALAEARPDGCTSVASRGPRGVVVGHTEDSFPQAVDGLYLLDATVTEPLRATGTPGGRFLCLNYAQTLPGCAAAVNEHGLIVLVDALPDPDRRVGAPRHFVSRALLDLPSIDAVIEHLRRTVRGGGWNYLLVQGKRIVDVEATATRVVVQEVDGTGSYAHSNHYLDPAIAAETAEPRGNSIARLKRALELVTPGMDVTAMKALLSDRRDFPDSICRDRTIGAFVADTAARRLDVCWGEPDGATWTEHAF
jgi:hypothetical protein